MIVAKEKTNKKQQTGRDALTLSAEEIVTDYRLAFQSRQASLVGRKEVMGGKAKFGIFGDGKEVAQVAMAKAFRKGDFRSGYYRDQTFMFATGMSNIQEFFAQLYAHADVEADPATAGRAMNAHFATRSLNPDGSWKNLTEMCNSSADVSPTGSQMPRLVGLAFASRLYRELKELQQFTQFSKKGNEIAFGIIGNATCAEGMFWETINAIGVLKAPALISIWDDEYGISVSNEHQVVKNISELLKGFERKRGSTRGFDVYRVKGWEYQDLVEIYMKAAETVRKEHVPAIVHVVEVTQPQGHSTSGSHERYKSKERLQWENEFDCIRKMREWIIDEGLKTAEEMAEIEAEDIQLVKNIRDKAWETYQTPIRNERDHIVAMIEAMAKKSAHASELQKIERELSDVPNLLRKNLMAAIRETLFTVRKENLPEKQQLILWKKEQEAINEERYGSHLYSESQESALKVPEIKPNYSENSPTKNGFEILNACFDAALARDPRVVAFGEDVGKLGGVNQGFKGLYKKYGDLRVSDTGIRECTIIGQAIGLAMRGLRPIAEIQYLDYLLYALQIMSDDLATVHWRTRGGQKAPVVIRTRGHRLEGIWHSGSLMSGIINLLRGIHVLVPRNMTQAAGFYNTLLKSDDPGIVIEVLNGYRIKEKLPDNIGEFTVPLGVPEVLREGTDVTIVTYGACCRIVSTAAEALSKVDIDVEVIDVKSLLPFDIDGAILESLMKTNRIVFVDEDVPGGASAYMMQEVVEKQGGYRWLDSEPRTVPGKPHRPAYGSDGDYFSKPNIEQIFEAVYELMHEANAAKYPIFFR
ncbi:transketolase [candidate division KSB1 bacterium]|nr:transketolase [candidate division KSB1 bacterium]NIR70467.1 transketolase [candidate division KSB1 bacterium]NIS23197.1 transketolase [candidate division KSB1 bacterium]NIT70057.1 transketolase [candidate division KSB1 bacterium]NIU23694.1 transketolase [candidate division KSB1 bacterium]